LWSIVSIYLFKRAFILKSINVPVLSATLLDSNNTGCSIFTNASFSLEDYNGLFITERQEALNFRYRISEPGYFSDWHVAGDSTLIIIRSGILRITLRNGDYQDFHAGDLFIAEDRLLKDEVFDDAIHGHSAQLIGEQVLHAVHIKLSSNS
jgi:hypothetical protein